MLRFLALLPLLAGCAGSVALKEAEPFGLVASALWLRYEDSEAEGLVLSNVPGACGKYQRFADASEAWQDAAEDVGFDFDDYCTDMKEPTLELAAAGQALFPPGANYLTLSVFDDGETTPERGTYKVGKGLSGNVAYYEDTRYGRILENWDEDADFEDGCGLDDDDFEDDVEYLSLDDGELEITGFADERSAAGRLEGDLQDESGDDEGEIAASFTAVYCEIDE